MAFVAKRNSSVECKNKFLTMRSPCQFTAILVVLLAIVLPFLPELVYPSDEVAFSLDDFKQQVKTGAVVARNVIVTGANSGLGLATVAHMAQIPNMHIIMACRSMERCETAKVSIENPHATAQLSCLQLDLGSSNSIEGFAAAVQEILAATGQDETQQTQPLHILINNAGQMGNSAAIGYVDKVETHIRINHLGHTLLTHCLWKNLVAGKARIVNVSSLVAVLPVNTIAGWKPLANATSKAASGLTSAVLNFVHNWVYYARSKRANLMFTSELHHRYNGTVTTVSSHPGYTRTRLLQKGFQFVPKAVSQFLFTNKLGSMSPATGALTQVRAALDNLRGGVHIGPKYWTAGVPVPVGIAFGWTAHHWPFSRAESRLLWDQSLETLGIREFGVYE